MKTKRRGNNSATGTRQDSWTPPAETGSLLTLDISAMDGCRTLSRHERAGFNA